MRIILFSFFSTIFITLSSSYIQKDNVLQNDIPLRTPQKEFSDTPGLFGYCQAPYPTVASYVPPVNATLLNVQILVRHGDRSPCNPLPIEDVFWDCDGVQEFRTVYRDTTYVNFIRDSDLQNGFLLNGTCYAGQLTPKGFQQQYAMGDSFRQIYSKYMQIIPPAIYVRSTNVERARQSGQAFLAGLLIGEFFGISINTAFDNTYDMLLPTTQYCPRLAEIADELVNSDGWKQMHPQNNEILNQLNEICPTANLTSWQSSYDHYFDNLNARICHNFSLPCSPTNSSHCVTIELAQSLSELAIQEWNYVYGGYLGQEKSSLETGFFINTLVQNMLNKINNPANTPSINLFAAHDETISMALSALNITQPIRPPYASNLAFELWQPKDTSKGNFIRVLSNGEFIVPVGCSAVECSFSDFSNYANNNIIPANYTKACEPHNPKYNIKN
eukprot:c19372_g1_i1.p1 GENE.c19372_g1_i1~~c19372_g1_i1.p1  ORF type:complete len:451 (+),score=153.94 c19372_g1_i1:22-1353(+)